MPDFPGLRHRSTRKFAAVLASHGLAERVVELPESTRTAMDAAQAVGCDVRQIVKSLVFRSSATGEPVLVLASGANRVDETWMARYVGGPLARADPELVRSVSGYAIGGVPPTGHASPIPTYVDYDLLELAEVWAAAGHPNAVCRLTPRELLHLTRARPVPVAPLPSPEVASAPWMTFDCYGTLINWRDGFAQAIGRLGIANSRSEGDRLFTAYLQEEPRVEAAAYRPYREVMAEALVRAAHAVGSELSPSLAKQVPESIPSWPLFPDSLEGLTALHERGTRVGILSNIDRDLLERTVAQHRLPVDLVVTAEDVRAYKPAPAHWIRFLKRTGTSPPEVMHVAGSYEYDLETAGALGFRTTYVARYEPPPPGKAIGAAVERLQELLR